MPETIMDRAIILTMRRKLSSEKVDRLRNADNNHFKVIKSKLARFVSQYSEIFQKSRPDLPESLNDRAQDNWEPLLAIADIAGDKWPELARDSAIKISGGYIQKDSMGTELLRDIQKIFSELKDDRISSADLIISLCQDHERPWVNFRDGKPLTNYQLSSLLREYGIQSKSVRFGDHTPKGFMLSQFEEVFVRYLSPDAENAATPTQCSNDAGLCVA